MSIIDFDNFDMFWFLHKKMIGRHNFQSSANINNNFNSLLLVVLCIDAQGCMGNGA
jgi:hypothetical protein